MSEQTKRALHAFLTLCTVPVAAHPALTALLGASHRDGAAAAFADMGDAFERIEARLVAIAGDDAGLAAKLREALTAPLDEEST